MGSTAYGLSKTTMNILRDLDMAVLTNDRPKTSPLDGGGVFGFFV